MRPSFMRQGALVLILAAVHELIAYALDAADPLAALLMGYSVTTIGLALLLLLLRIGLMVVLPAAVAGWLVHAWLNNNEAQNKRA